jgi:hypothetical protein
MAGMARTTPVAVLFAAAALCLVCGPGPNYPPDAPSLPAGPAMVKKSVGAYFASSALDRNDDSVRYQFYWGDGTHSNWGSFLIPGRPDSLSHAWSRTGTYNVQVRAKDIHGEVSDSSPAHAVAVLESLPNQAPNTPNAPSGPDQGIVLRTCLFTAQTTDPDGDDVSIQFDWGDGTYPRWSPYVFSGETVTDSHAWSQAGNYSIRAMAKDKKGVISDWSSQHSIRIDSL